MNDRILSGVALLPLAAALLVSGCNKPATATNTTDSNAVAAIENGAAVETIPEDADAAASDAASASAPVSVPDVPIAPSTVTPADTLPLTEATATAQAISRGVGITRVRRADGWAWLQGDDVVRTASLDGSRVSYFHRGQSTPYYVQADKDSYAYAGGRVTHSYGTDGIPQAPDADHARMGERYADQARQEHDRTAQDIRDRQLHHDDGHAPPVPPARARPDHAPAPQPSPVADHHDGHDRHGPAPAPAATPQPDRDRQDHHGGSGR